MSQTKQKTAGFKTELNLINGGRILEVCWPGSYSRFHAVWLRDNGQDAKTRDPSNFQKLITLQDIPENTVLESASINPDYQLELTFQPDQWHTIIDIGWLWTHRYDLESSDSKSIFPENVSTWDAALRTTAPSASWPDAKSNPEVLLDWLSGLDRYGIALMHDLPEKNRAILDVIELFGYVRETNYGRYFEIRSEINPINLAYTSRGLQPHTDNPYRDPPPGLQFFGCLENSVDGGESVVVDGFRVAEIIRQENSDWFALLSTYNVRFEYRGTHDVHLLANHPMIEKNVNGLVTAIHFNNRSCDALTGIPFDSMETYYQAYRRFAELTNTSDLQVEFKLAPGQLFVTDNTRVLHGRTGFSTAGNRWMQGAYSDKDSLQSKIRILGEQLKNQQVNKCKMTN